jgi:hypothetical protein
MENDERVIIFSRKRNRKLTRRRNERSVSVKLMVILTKMLILIWQP